MQESSTKRAELLDALAELSELHPGWRLGQMMASLAMSAGRSEASAVWDLEDSEALAAAQRLIVRERHEAAQSV